MSAGNGGASDLQKGDFVRRPLELWLNNFSENTQYRYRQRFFKFQEAVRQVRSKAMDDVAMAEFARSDPISFSQLLIDVYKHLRSQSYSPKYCAGIVEAIRSFARYNGASLPKEPRVITKEAVYTIFDVLTDEEVRKTEFAALTGRRYGLRDAAIIAVLRQSGQRRSVLTALRWGMVKDQVMKGGEVVVNVPGPLTDLNGNDVRKVKVPYRFGWGSEATALIKEMMESRMRKGEPIDDDSFLFRSYAEATPDGPKTASESERGWPVTDDIVWRVVLSSANIAGTQREIKTDRGETLYRITPKAFRAYFKFKVRQAFQDGAFKNMTLDFDMELVRYLMGQKCSYQNAYDKFTEEYVREFYRCIDKYITLGTVGHIPSAGWRHMVVSLDELPGYLDRGYELLKELSNQKYLIRTRV